MLAHEGVFKQLQDTDTSKSFRRRFDAATKIAKNVSRLFLLETK